MPSPPPQNETLLFRPSKKRKIYRQRASSTDDLRAPPTTSPPPPPAQSLDELVASTSAAPAADEVEGTPVSINEILRLRKQRRPRVGGVGFTASGNLARDGETGELVVVRREEGVGHDDVGGSVGRKFAPQTGTVGDVDKHMMAFIDSRLARSRLEGLEASAQDQNTNTPAAMVSREGGVVKDNSDVQRQPAALGRLLEIDLGDEARSRNVERTDLARRRADGEAVVEDGEGGKKDKIRLGPDGKPWRTKKKRRGSDDVKRDMIVEDVLRENRLELYDEIPVEETTINDDQTADDRIAEAFRREFMDAVSQRQRKAAPPQAPSRNVGGKKEEELKGPKLGGSRSARAAMRETLLKSSKK